MMHWNVSLCPPLPPNVPVTGMLTRHSHLAGRTHPEGCPGDLLHAPGWRRWLLVRPDAGPILACHEDNFSTVAAAVEAKREVF